MAFLRASRRRLYNYDNYRVFNKKDLMYNYLGFSFVTYLYALTSGKKGYKALGVSMYECVHINTGVRKFVEERTYSSKSKVFLQYSAHRKKTINCVSTLSYIGFLEAVYDINLPPRTKRR